MRAAVTQPGSTVLLIDDVDIAEPQPGMVRVRVHHCGVCHSDYGMLQLAAAPTILGHEAAGVVEAVGPDVSLVAPGDKVVVTPVSPCHRCYFCLHGAPTLCTSTSEAYTGTFADGTTGLSRRGEVVYRGVGVAGFAEYLLARETATVKVPADTPLDIACVIGCAVQTGVGAVLNTASVEPGSSVLVSGLGGVGLSVVQGARAAGAACIIGVDRVPARRDAALRMGATHVIDPDTDDIVAVTREITDVGADYSFEAAGSARLAEIDIEATRPGGTTVLVGVPPADEAITIKPVVAFGVAEKHLVGCALGSCHSMRDIPRFIAMWRAGQLDLDALVTHRRPLEEINDAFADLEAGVGIRTAISLV
jgi:Zn-dependent alcohol dehydrogenase